MRTMTRPGTPISRPGTSLRSRRTPTAWLAPGSWTILAWWSAFACGTAVGCWSTPAAAQTVPAREAQESWRLGGVSAPGYASWSRAPGVIAAPDGSIVVVSSQPPVIAEFDAAGAFVRYIGGEGEGPGEFRVASHHGWIGDTLWVANFPEPRISLFDGNGAHLDTRRFDPIDFGVDLSAPGSVSALLEGGQALAVPESPPLGAPGRIAVPVLIGDRAMADARRLFDVWLPRTLVVRGLGSFAYQAFAAPPLLAVASDGSGLVRAQWDDDEPGEMQVTRFGPDGEVIWDRGLPYPPRAVPAAERARWIDEGVAIAEPYAGRAQSGLPGSLRDLVEEGLYLPAHEPPALALLLDIDRRTWIRVESGGPLAEWLVLSPDGVPSFRIRLPSGLTPCDAHGSALWGTLIGDFDVPYVIQYEVR